ncbi:MAG: CPBP family intramembrane glutamic endopeptidase [Huintestinicola sp.]
MKTDKKTEIIRLVIFYVLALLPLCIMTACFNSTVDDGYIYNHLEDKAAKIYALGALGMMCPSVAVVLTRLITKEGFKNSYLGINFKGNGKYYAASVLVLLADSVINMFLAWKLYSSASFGEMFTGDDMAAKIWLLIVNIEGAVIMFFPSFGEEWGWRGYMMPKLIKLIGKPAAIILGGVLWGLWHFPLTISGHNFGTDYKFYPWLGIVLMCVFCTIFNVFLTFLAERTKSVYPCAFAHGINNSVGAVVLLNIFGNAELLDKLEGVSMVTQNISVMGVKLILAIVCFVLLMKKGPESAGNTEQ